MRISKRTETAGGALLLAALFLSAAVSAAPKKKGKDSYIEIKVNKGDTLTVIARRYLDDPRRWRELLRYNKIPRPNLIYPGRVLRVPGYLARQPLATVRSFSTRAQYSPGARSSWSEVGAAQSLYERDRLRTDSSGSISLLLASARGGVLVRPNSYLVLVKRGGGKKSAPLGLLLNRGRMESFVSPRRGGKKPRFRVDTPAARVVVRGTRFTTTVDKKQNTAVACRKGLIAVSAQGKTVAVKAGFAVFVKKGRAPGKPFTLLRPPQVRITP